MVHFRTIAERKMTSAIATTIKLVFKPGILICDYPKRPRILQVGDVLIPEEVF
jgi:hypothetical protein